MGSEKGLLLLHGKELIRYSIELLEKFCENILISSDHKTYSKFGYKRIPDLYPDKGPLGGIYSALKSTTTRQNLILSCDIPFISTSLIKFLLKQSGNATVCIPQFNGKPEPLCGFYRQDVISEMENLLYKDQLKLTDFLNKVQALQVPINNSLPFYHPNLFLNMNRPEDLETAEKLLSFRE